MTTLRSLASTNYGKLQTTSECAGQRVSMLLRNAPNSADPVGSARPQCWHPVASKTDLRCRYMQYYKIMHVTMDELMLLPIGMSARDKNGVKGCWP
jgi:hypothetical protein